MEAPLTSEAAPRTSRAWVFSEDDLPPGVTSTQQEAEHRWLLSTGFFETEPYDAFGPLDAEGLPSVAAQVRYEDVGDRAA
jgi:hypothetical protein